jgi:hypothetical protein
MALLYLTNRTQSVKISFYYSDEYAVTSGVPQGSHLGPLLFLIFINNLSLVLDTNINILLFADDAKLYFDIKSINDANRLESNLNTFFQWSERNLLPLNISKCQVISFSRNKNPIIFQYQINNHYLDRVYTVRALGIYFENDLSFKLNHSIIII